MSLLTAEVKLLVWIISTVIVSVAFPMRLDAYVVLALKQEGRAVCAVGKAGRWKSVIKKNMWCMLHSLMLKLFFCDGDSNYHQKVKKTLCWTLTTKRLICIVQTVSVAIAFEAFSDTVSTATLKVTGMTSPQLCNTAKPALLLHIQLYTTHGKGH